MKARNTGSFICPSLRKQVSNTAKILHSFNHKSDYKTKFTYIS